MQEESFPGSEGEEIISALKAKAIGPTHVGLSDDGFPICGVNGRGPLGTLIEAHIRGCGGEVSYQWSLQVTLDNHIYIGLDASFMEPERGEAFLLFDLNLKDHLIAVSSAHNSGKLGLTPNPQGVEGRVNVLMIECGSEDVIPIGLQLWQRARAQRN